MDEDAQYQLPNPNQTGQQARFFFANPAPSPGPPQQAVPPLAPQRGATAYNWTAPQLQQPAAEQLSPNYQMPSQAAPQQPVYQLPAQAASDNVLNTQSTRDQLSGLASYYLDKIKKNEDAESTSHPGKLASIMEAIGADRGGILGMISQGIAAQRQQRELETQNAYKALGSLTSMVGQTQIKPLIADVKAQNQAAETARRQVKDQFMNTYQKNKEARLASHAQAMEDFNQKKLELQKYGIDTRSFDLGEHRKQMQAFYDQTDKRLRDIANLNAYIHVHGDNQQAQIALARAQQAMQKDQAEIESKTQQFNQSLAMKLQERDKDSGAFKYRDEQGQPLDPKQYMLHFEGFNNTLPQIDEDAEAQDAIARYAGQANPIAVQPGERPGAPELGQQQAAPAQAAVAQRNSALNAAAIQQRTKQLGLNKYQGLTKIVQAARQKGYTEDEAYELAKQAGF